MFKNFRLVVLFLPLGIKIIYEKMNILKISCTSFLGKTIFYSLQKIKSQHRKLFLRKKKYCFLLVFFLLPNPELGTACLLSALSRLSEGCFDIAQCFALYDVNKSGFLNQI